MFYGERELELAARHVAEGAARVLAQRLRVHDRRSSGRPSRLGEQLLEAMEQSHARAIDHLERIAAIVEAQRKPH